MQEYFYLASFLYLRAIVSNCLPRNVGSSPYLDVFLRRDLLSYPADGGSKSQRNCSTCVPSYTRYWVVRGSDNAVAS
jgi:hypothetical protein